MTKTEFLQNRDVSGFVAWLAEHLPKLRFHLAFSPSRFVPGGLHATVTGIEEVRAHYAWKNAWKDGDEIVHSADWPTTRLSLQRLRGKLRAAAATRDDAALLAACLAVLEWGGVSSARPFLRRKAAAGQLVAYLERAAQVLELDGDRRLDDIDGGIIERYDAGLTKIHALLDTTGSPIYDSRVGAAVAMLYALYRAGAGGEIPPALRLPSGSARGKQLRNPRTVDAGFPAAPQFYTPEVTNVSWAQSQVKLGWIIQAVLARTDWFASEGKDVPARAHAFEAALFMIGYDLRCIQGGPVATPTSTSTSAATWVPAGHTFSTLFGRYVEFRRELAAEGRLVDDERGDGFSQWLDRRHGPYQPGALQAYRFPFKQAEFDLFGRDWDDILGLHDAIASNDTAGIANFLADYDLGADERRNVCLVDAWCAGYLRDKGLDGAESNRILIAAGFAGTENTATLLLRVGRNVGRLFKLLDRDGRPTPLFHACFRDTLDDLARQLDQV